MVATGDQSVIMICSLFVPGTLPFFALSFPFLVIKSHHLQKVLGGLFTKITFVPDPINIVVESDISVESRPAIIITSVPDPGSLLKK